MGCLIECLKGHFHKTQPRLTEQQRAEQARRLQASLPEGTSISEQLVRLATDIQMVDSIALLPPSQDSNWVAINMYVDDQGAVKQLPPNVRAADILATCGVPQQAHGDVFIAKLRDCEAQDIFERLDFKLSMMNSSADWVRQCQLAHRRAKGGSPAAALDRMTANGKVGSKASAFTPSLASSGTTAEEEKAVGNRFFKKGNFTKAIEHYSKAIKLDNKVAAYYSNRAICLLKQGKFLMAEVRLARARPAGGLTPRRAAGGYHQIDCGKVIELEPTNVKGYFLRACAREGLQKFPEALEDFKKVLALDPSNEEAGEKVRALEARIAGGDQGIEEIN